MGIRPTPTHGRSYQIHTFPVPAARSVAESIARSAFQVQARFLRRLIAYVVVRLEFQDILSLFETPGMLWLLAMWDRPTVTTILLPMSHVLLLRESLVSAFQTLNCPCSYVSLDSAVFRHGHIGG